MFDKKTSAMVQQAIDNLIGKVSELGCTVDVEPDMSELKTFMTERNTFVNPTFDPEKSDLTDQDFWVRVRDQNGKSIAASAERVLQTVDFMDLLATGKLFYRGGYKDVGDWERIDVIRPRIKLSGQVSHSGSTWVDPEWRGQGFALIMPYLSRALSFRNSNCIANTGFVRRNLFESPVPLEIYGYAHVERCMHTFFPPQGEEEELFLCWISSGEFVEKAHLLPEHPRYPVENRVAKQRVAIAAE